ncbi:MAG: hypothetical protein ACLTAF_12445 [Blautia coccoides]
MKKAFEQFHPAYEKPGRHFEFNEQYLEDHSTIAEKIMNGDEGAYKAMRKHMEIWIEQQGSDLIE